MHLRTVESSEDVAPGRCFGATLLGVPYINLCPCTSSPVVQLLMQLPKEGVPCVWGVRTFRFAMDGGLGRSQDPLKFQRSLESSKTPWDDLGRLVLTSSRALRDDQGQIFESTGATLLLISVHIEVSQMGSAVASPSF